MVSRILLADDSITIQKVVNLTFADEGIEVVAVSNGEMAARRLEEVNPDLVLADIFMPGKNGYELCEAIKTSSQFRNVPVVLLVGAFEPFDQVEARRVRADAHLTKPFESRTLVETVRKLLGNTDRPHTGPLTASPGHQDSSASQEPSASVEDQNTWLTPASVDLPATLEFESASGQWTAGDTPKNEQVGGPPVAETLPLVLGQRALEDSPDSGSDQSQFSSSDIEPEVTFWERPTGELVSPPGAPSSSEGSVSSEDQRVIPTDSSFEVQSPADIAVAEHRKLETEPLALTVDSNPLTQFVQQQMVVDFDESLPATPQSEADVSITETNNSEIELDGEKESGSNEWQMKDVQHAANEWRAENAVNLITTRLELPDMRDDDHPSPEVDSGTAGAFSFSEAPAIAESSSLFTAEEPLGDVLFDNGDCEPLTQSNASTSPLDEAAMTEFALELPPGEAVGGGQVTVPAAVDQSTPGHSERVTGELVTADLPMDGQTMVECAAANFDAHEALETPAEAPEQLVDRALQPVAEDEAVSGDGSLSDYVSYDWTSPAAMVHSTGRLDSTVMPVESPEASQDLVQEEALLQPATADVSQEEPLNLEADQMRFAAIDVAPSPVEDAGALVQPFHASQPERGFDISQVIAVDQAPSPSDNGHREASEEASPRIELSPMVIDEIVRRVVAQIGDTVVREIAWEIVPDCVERIIEQQTREALAKR